jgi:hypothetical protein
LTIQSLNVHLFFEMKGGSWQRRNHFLSKPKY